MTKKPVNHVLLCVLYCHVITVGMWCFTDRTVGMMVSIRIRIFLTFSISVFNCGLSIFNKRLLLSTTIFIYQSVQWCSNCNCNWGTCIAPPTRRPRAHHRVNPYPGACRQNETEMFSDHDETSPSIAAIAAVVQRIFEQSLQSVGQPTSPQLTDVVDHIRKTVAIFRLRVNYW